MTDTKEIMQVISATIYDTLEVNLHGVTLKRFDRQKEIEKRFYGHIDFTNKIKRDENRIGNENFDRKLPLKISKNYLNGFDKIERDEFIQVLMKYYDKKRELNYQPFGERWNPFFLASVILWVLFAILSFFIFTIPLFNSIISYKHLFGYITVAYIVVYIVGLKIFNNSDGYFNKYKLIRVFFGSLILFSQFGTLYSFICNDIYTINGTITNFYCEYKDKGTKQIETVVFVQLDNCKRIVLREKSSFNGAINFEKGDRLTCFFKPLLPGIDLFLERKI